MNDVAISVEGLGKSYRLRMTAEATRYRTLRDEFMRLPARLWKGLRAAPGEEFWALRDVSFQVKKGEVLGVIGRNGAGKSTLLKILSRIVEPTTGGVDIYGRVGSLLEVGTGFHPELTGRENIYLSGAMLGMRRHEVRAQFDEIVAFAEVEQFIDTPCKFYSSGMYTRLGFAVAAHLRTDILLVDEVLAVGDAEFQRRCLGKMSEVCEGGRTILFVSHNMQAVRQLCSRVVWLDHGSVKGVGPSEVICDDYLVVGQRAESLVTLNEEIAQAPEDRIFKLHSVDVMQNGISTTELVSGKPVEIRFTYDVFLDVRGLHLYFLICDMDGSLIFDSLHNGADNEQAPLVKKGSYVSTAVIPADFLAGRTYELQIQAAIDGVRAFFRKPPSLYLHVHRAGLVNRAYVGYVTPGKIAPLILWTTDSRTE